jgi:hypothetical protein
VKPLFTVPAWLAGGGLWIDQPHTAIAFGFLYFLLVGLGEMVLVGRLASSERKRRQ